MESIEKQDNNIQGKEYTDTINHSSSNMAESKELCIFHLKSTQKWFLFFSAIGFISSILMICAGIFLMMDRPFWSPLRIFFSVVLKHHVLYGISVIGLGILMIIPSINLFKSSQCIKLYLKEGITEHITSALKYFKSVCRFYGISSIIFIVSCLIYYMIN